MASCGSIAWGGTRTTPDDSAGCRSQVGRCILLRQEPTQVTHLDLPLNKDKFQGKFKA